MDAPLTRCFGALDARIAREVLRLRARYQLSLDEFRGLYVSDEQVDRILDPPRADSNTVPDAPLPRPAAAASEQTQWIELVRTFDLDPLEQDLLLIGVAAEFDLKYETLFAYLNDDVTRKWPTADIARRLLRDVDQSARVLGALSPGGRLHAGQLIERIPPPGGRPALLNAGFCTHPSLTLWLHGDTTLSAIDAPGVTWVGPEMLPSPDGRDLARAEPIARLLNQERPRSSLPIVAMLGPPGSGRRRAAAAIARISHRALVSVDIRSLRDGEGDAADVLDRMNVALALRPAVVLMDGIGAHADDDARHGRARARVDRVLARWSEHSLILLRTGAEERWREIAGGCRVVEARCDDVEAGGRTSMWRCITGAAGIELREFDLLGLAGRFVLTPGQLRAAVSTAVDLTRMHGGTAPEHLAAAARLTSDQALGRLATKLELRHGWDDLVLPAATVRRLRELTAAIRHRHVVYGAWGFDTRIANGTGIKALFAGASGTGKTMAAGVIARDLELDLYRIDLSGVVSKYIGETEKNLDRIFRAARAANAIVFLDEAEAIMGKRSDVKDAHDRYANIEVAYLLQKLEDHEGIVILATNLRRNIDDAFNRRMQYVVDFPRPAEAERERIWRGMFPADAPVDPGVDFAFLAREFDLSGGDIRNVALDAAFLAAADGGVIAMRAIVGALSRQMVKEGKTPTGTDFRQYQRLLVTRR